MNRRMAVLVGSTLAALAVAEIVVLSGLLAAERRDDRERYRDAMARQRRDAGRVLPVATAPRKARTPLTFCVRGVDTFATTVRATLDKELLDGQRRIDVAELGVVSDLAIQAERYAETASGGPPLPQRLGRTRVEPGSPPAKDRKSDESSPVWQPIDPPRVDCDGDPAFAAFRLDVDIPPPPARPAVKATTRPGQKAKAKKKTTTRSKAAGTRKRGR